MAFMFYGNPLSSEYQGHYSILAYKYHHTCCHFLLVLRYIVLFLFWLSML